MPQCTSSAASYPLPAFIPLIGRRRFGRNHRLSRTGFQKDIRPISRIEQNSHCLCVLLGTSIIAASIRHHERFKNEKLILLDPAKAQTDAAQLQGQLMGGRAPSEFFFCESIEAAIILSQAGFGISILPDLFIPPELSLARIPIENIAPASFGIYYKSIQGNPPLRALLQIMRSRIEKNIPITNYH